MYFLKENREQQGIKTPSLHNHEGRKPSRYLVKDKINMQAMTKQKPWRESINSKTHSIYVNN